MNSQQSEIALTLWCHENPRTAAQKLMYLEAELTTLRHLAEVNLKEENDEREN